MADSNGSWWLRAPDGVAMRISSVGLLVGRSPHCDIVVRNPHASRRQALVYVDAEGAHLSVMGRGTVSVDDLNVAGDVALADGARISVADLELEVRCEEGRATLEPATAVWVLENPEGGLFSFSHSPFFVGGGDEDDLRIEGWPKKALQLEMAGGRLMAKAEVALDVDGDRVDAGSQLRLRRGSTISLDGKKIRLVTGGELGTGSTISLDPEMPGARVVRLEFLPRGGRLHVTMSKDERSVYLSDRRCDFAAVLLSPPTPLSPGDFVPDELVWSRVWGKRPSGRKTLHVLLHRLRKDLERVGLDAQMLLVRAQGGGATRFTLRKGARVAVE